MKLLTAKQHGAWAMLFIPFLLNMIVGGARWEHSLFLVAWLGFYLASYPFLMSLRGKNRNYYLKWFAGYLSVAVISLIYPLIVMPELIYFGFMLIPGFLVNMYYSKTKNDRALMNDFVAIFNFCIGGLASYFFGAGVISQTAWLLFAYAFIFFVGTTFYVKTMIREKNSKWYKYISWGYHTVVPLTFIVLGYYIVALAYIPSLIRAVALYGKKLPIMTIGIIEIINAFIFFVVIVIAMLT